MSCPKVRCPVRAVWFLWIAAWMAAVGPAWKAGAGELPPGVGYGAEDLHAWQNRLARLDEATPAPDLLGIDRLIAYEENADFAYAFGERSAEDNAAFSEGFEFVWLKPSAIQTGADADRRHASWSLMLKRR